MTQNNTTAHAAFAPVPSTCTCGATQIEGCFCGTTQADWAAAAKPAATTGTATALDLLADDSRLAQDVARDLGVSTETARRRLEALVTEGKATRSKGRVFRHGRYVPAVYYTAA